LALGALDVFPHLSHRRLPNIQKSPALQVLRANFLVSFTVHYESSLAKFKITSPMS
jgi:hypothetical protein